MYQITTTPCHSIYMVCIISMSGHGVLHAEVWCLTCLSIVSYMHGYGVLYAWVLCLTCLSMVSYMPGYGVLHA